MKKIIKGKMYDTTTAKMVGENYSSLPSNDFNFFNEELYLKKNNEYFLFLEGGPLSKYGEIRDGARCWAKKIMPVTEAEAKKWAEINLTCEEYIDIFGAVEE